MKYDKKIADEVSDTLGRPLPPPDSEAFDDLLLGLKQSDPKLAEKLSSALIHNGLGDIETQARRQNIGESRFRRLTHVLFRRFDELDGEWHLSKIKLLAWGSLIPFAFMGSLFLGPSLVGSTPKAVADVAEPVSDAGGAVDVAATPQDEDPFEGRPEAVSQNNRVTTALSGSRRPPETANSAQSEKDTPLAVDDFAQDKEVNASSPEQQTGTQTEGTTTPASMLGGDPQLPTTSEAEDPGLGVYRASSPEDSAEPGLAVYRADGTVASTAGGSDPFAQQDNSGEGTVGLAAYRRAESQEETSTGLEAYSQESEPNSEIRAYRQTPPQTGVATGNADVLPVSATAENTYVASEPAFAAEYDTAPAPKEAEPYTVGDSLKATLQTGVVAIGDAPLPVLARAEDGSIWQGQATLTPTGRVDLRFSEVLAEGGQYQVAAVGQSNDGYLGLPAQIGETTPALASDLARGALRGLSDYVQALGDQTEVRLEGGTPIISQNAPPLEASIAGSVAQLFTPPEGDEQQALVRLAQVPADTPLKVVVLAQPNETP